MYIEKTKEYNIKIRDTFLHYYINEYNNNGNVIYIYIYMTKILIRSSYCPVNSQSGRNGVYSLVDLKK